MSKVKFVGYTAPYSGGYYEFGYMLASSMPAATWPKVRMGIRGTWADADRAAEEAATAAVTSGLTGKRRHGANERYYSVERA